MKLPKIKSVEVEYIESGTFCGGEEDVFNAGVERGETCVVIKKGDFLNLKKALKLIQDDETGDFEFCKHQIEKLFKYGS